MSLPYYKLFPKEFDADDKVRIMDLSQLGLYIACLNFSWVNRGLPIEPEEIRLSLKISKGEFAKAWARVEACFPVDGERRWNPRQRADWEEAAQKSAKNSAARAQRTNYERSTNVERMLNVSSTNVLPHARARTGSGCVVSGNEFEKKKNQEVPVSEVWARSGFRDFEDFEVWFEALYDRHPTRGQPQIAKDLLRNAFVSGVTRLQVEDAYEKYQQSAAWRRDGGRVIPKLSVLCTDEFWKFPPRELPEQLQRGEPLEDKIARL